MEKQDEKEMDMFSQEGILRYHHDPFHGMYPTDLCKSREICFSSEESATFQGLPQGHVFPPNIRRLQYAVSHT